MSQFPARKASGSVPGHYGIPGLEGLSKTLWERPLSNILVLGLICRPGCCLRGTLTHMVPCASVAAECDLLNTVIHSVQPVTFKDAYSSLTVRGWEKVSPSLLQQYYNECQL